MKSDLTKNIERKINRAIGKGQPDPLFHRSISMTYVEDIGTARDLFGFDVAPPSVLLRTAGAAELFGSVKGVTASTLAARAYAMYDPKAKLALMEFGLDWSVYNGTWRHEMLNSYTKAQIRYVISRMGQSYAYEDPTFRRNMLNLQEFNPQIDRMGYHVIYPGSPVDPQVANMVKIYNRLKNEGGVLLSDSALIPSVWLDLELHHNQTAKVIWEKTYRFIEEWRRITGTDIGIYTGMWFLLAYCQPFPRWFLEGVYKWLAQYNNPAYGERETLTAYPEDADPAYIAIHQTGSYFDALKMGAVGDGNTRTDGNRFNPLGAVPFTYLQAVGRVEVDPTPEPFPNGDWVSTEDFAVYRAEADAEINDLRANLLEIAKGTQNVMTYQDLIDALQGWFE